MTILAIDIGGTAIKYALVDDNNNISSFSEIPSEAKLGASALLEKVYKIIEAHISDCDAISISTAGRVDSENGRIIFANKNIHGDRACKAYNRTIFKACICRK